MSLHHYYLHFFLQMLISICPHMSRTRKNIWGLRSEENWRAAFNTMHKGLMNVTVQQHILLVYSHWYKAPTLLHWIFPNTSNLCWRCEDAERSRLHIWWLKDHKVLLDKSVVASSVTSYPLEFSPTQYLLYHSSVMKGAYHKSLAIHIINAARLGIPVQSRPRQVLSLKLCFTRSSKVAQMDELIYIRLARL